MKWSICCATLLTAFALSACSDNTNVNESKPTQQPPASAVQVVEQANPEAASQIPANLPVLKVFTDDTYPPFASKDKNGQIEGLDVDLFTAVAKNQGYDVQFYPHIWEGIFKRLADGSADVIVSAVGITEESQASADLSDVYYKTPYRVATLEPAKFDLKDWATQPKIAVSSSEDAETDLPERFNVKPSQIIVKDSVFLAIQEVAKGKANVVVADSTVLQYYMASPTFKEHKIEFASQDLPAGQGSNLVFAVKKGNKELLNKLNKGLANVKASGEYEQILQKWHQSLPASATASAPASN